MKNAYERRYYPRSEAQKHLMLLLLRNYRYHEELLKFRNFNTHPLKVLSNRISARKQLWDINVIDLNFIIIMFEYLDFHQAKGC